MIEEFQQFRRILCVCPCCGDIVRLSDLRLTIKGKGPKSWRDDFDAKARKLEKKEEQFAEKEDELREKAREKGRRQAKKVFDKAITPALKSMRINPYDVKPVMHPIDFVVFNGMADNEGLINDVLFLSKVSKNADLRALRERVKGAIRRKNYEWQLARIDDNGGISFE